MADKYNIEADIDLIDRKVNTLKSSSAGVAASEAIGNLLKAKAQLIGVTISMEQMVKYEELMKEDELPADLMQEPE